MEHRCQILMSEFVTHDVKRFVLERPDGFQFSPGQGVELSIDREGWREEGRPFTPTSLPDDKVLEFTIKGYSERNGVTRQLHQMESGDAVFISDPFGTINYHGPGVFIAGGAGITPFLSILRMLGKQQKLAGNSLLFSNKTPRDIICEKELKQLLGDRAEFLCSRKDDCHCNSGRLDPAYLERAIDDYSQRFYVCGPPPFVDAINDALVKQGASPDALVFEQ